MSKRELTISEEFGVYFVRVRHGVGATGRTAEDAILRALKLTPGAVPQALEIHSSHDMGEVIETLLGPKREDSGLAVAV